jgi:PHD/YefM family antitoxin component YafN of YafNO toxin-antitoxin module
MSTTATASEVTRGFATYNNIAKEEPVIITKNGKPCTVLLSYNKFLRLSAITHVQVDEIAVVEPRDANDNR